MRKNPAEAAKDWSKCWGVSDKKAFMGKGCKENNVESTNAGKGLS